MKNLKVTCDACGRDITTTGNSIDYRLALVSQELPHSGDTVTDMMIYPPIEQDHHFCGTTCLKNFVIKNF